MMNHSLYGVPGLRGSGLISLVRAWMFVLASFVVISIFFRFSFFEEIRYSLFIDRDLYRAFNLLSEFQFGGAELSQGGRAPGGFFYYMLWGLIQISPDPQHIHWIMVGLNSVGIIVLGLLGRRLFGTLSGLAAAAFYGASFLQFNQHQVLWNPGFISLFAVGSYWLFLEVLADHDERKLPWAVFITACLVQVHLSGVLLLVFFLVAILVLRIQIRQRWWWWSLVALVTAFAPALGFELTHGFETTRSIGELRDVFIQVGRVDTPQITDRILSFVKLTLSAGLGVGVRQWPDSSAAALRFIAGISVSSFLFVLVSGYAVWAGVGRSAGAMPERERRIVKALLIVLSGGIFITIASSQSNDFRKLNVFVPGFVLLAGLALRTLITVLATSRRRKVCAVIGGVLLLWATAYLSWHTLWWVPFHMVHAPSSATLGQLKTVIRNVRARYSFTDSDILTKVALMAHDPRWGWTRFNPRTVAISYLISKVPGQPDGERYDGCILALRNEKPGKSLTDKQVDAALSKLHVEGLALLDTMLEAGESFTYVGYRLSSGSCLRSFTNRYIATPEEALIEQRKGELPNDGALLLEAGAGIHKILIRSGDVAPAYLLLVLSRDGETTFVTFHGNVARGYMGLLAHRYLRPRIVLTPVGDGAPVPIPIFHGWIGGEYGIVTTPWRSSLVRVPSGLYHFAFEAERLVALKSDLGPVSMSLAAPIELE